MIELANELRAEVERAANNHQRFVRAQAADPFVWPGYEPVALGWLMTDSLRHLRHHLAQIVGAGREGGV
jgi:hypothetical protein